MRVDLDPVIMKLLRQDAGLDRAWKVKAVGLEQSLHSGHEPALDRGDDALRLLVDRVGAVEEHHLRSMSPIGRPTPVASRISSTVKSRGPRQD